MAETPNSGSATPNDSRFVSKAADVEDRLKADTVGLVTLDDFRKRRAEAIEGGSGTTPPDGRDSTSKSGVFKKRKKAGLKKGGLSFGNYDEEGEANGEDDWASVGATPNNATRSNTPATALPGEESDASSSTAPTTTFKKKSLRPNSTVGLQPKALTKSALLKEAQLKDALRKEYAQIQEAVKATEFVLPFVFYDGKNVPGGMVRLKKEDKIWLFLERARKLGAEAGRGDRGRKDWARISVDDLMVVRGDLIIPHHYDFHYFLLNKTIGYHGPLFSNHYSSEPTSATPQHLLPSKSATSTKSGESTDPVATSEAEESHLQTAAQLREAKAAQLASAAPDSDLEGFDGDPNLTKVVDRRWYERSKHIYPASSWEEFDPAKEEDYKKGVKKDRDGNAMFFGR